MFENFNGTPLQTLLSLTMKRAEFGGSGALAAFARKVVGIEVGSDRMSEYQATADYAKAQDSAQDRAQDSAQGAACRDRAIAPVQAAE
jgi:hypothetical protein